MSSPLSCPQCNYTTTQVGHFNRHLNTHRRNARTVTETCARCGRSFKVGGSGLRQHTTKFSCLAAPELQPFDHNAFEDGSYTLGLQNLRSLSSYLLRQHGFADPDVTRVALATVKYLHVNAAFPRWQNVRPCQFDAEKLVVVEQMGEKKVWVAYPKESVLEDLQREIAGILLGLVDAEKLPMKHSDELARFAEYGLHTGKPHSYAAIFVRQRPELQNQRLKTLEDILTLLQWLVVCASLPMWVQRSNQLLEMAP